MDTNTKGRFILSHLEQALKSLTPHKKDAGIWSNTQPPAETGTIYESDFDAGLKERVAGEEM
ncbi:MAG: hypothetical protein HXS40_12870 [Theionarchaea archaeon]|nr:hypothetical protein [Theionarchaea archaeon]